MVRVRNGLLFFAMLLCSIVLSSSPSNAQSLSDYQSKISLSTVPSFPQPNSTVTVTLDAYSMNTVGSSIFWYVDGKEMIEGRNERSISFTTGKIGTEHTVRVRMTSNGVPLQTELSIQVGAVDLIIEAETSVPDFYEGRALPAENAPIRAIAIVHGKTNTAPERYTYEWSLDGSVLFGGPVQGKYAVTFDMPPYADHRLMVTVYDTNRSTLGRNIILLNGVEPELYFYETNPLRGLSRKALTPTFTMTGEETTILAEPYFMDTRNVGGEGDAEWTMNGSSVNPGNSEQNAITLRHTGGEGSANLGFRYVLKHVGEIPTYVAGAFDVFFK